MKNVKFYDVVNSIFYVVSLILMFYSNLKDNAADTAFWGVIAILERINMYVRDMEKEKQ